METFQKILKASGLELKFLSDSLSPDFNREMVFKAGEGAGASGSFFFYSHDSRFLVKTMTRSEVDFFLAFLPDYCNHLLSNAESLLAKIFGVFTIETNNAVDVHVMLMENTLKFSEDAKLKHIFDLKGSRVNREVKEKLDKPSTTLKDTNYLKLKHANKGNLVDLEEKSRKRVVKGMRADVKFLKE
jgi:hypothetical protein